MICQNEYHHKSQDFRDNNEFTNLNLYPTNYLQMSIKQLVNNTNPVPRRKINGNFTIKIQYILH